MITEQKYNFAKIKSGERKIALDTKKSYVASKSRSAYIDSIKNIAIEQQKKYKIPASITIAQAIIESGDGNSTLAKQGKNHFGIKCHGWSGDKSYHDDDKPNECFRNYDTIQDSFEDHSKFLKKHSRYNNLFELDITDYKGWAKGLKKAGYATSPTYAEALIDIIESNNLQQYDTSKLSTDDETKTDTKTDDTKKDADNLSLNAIRSYEKRLKFYANVIYEAYDYWSDRLINWEFGYDYYSPTKVANYIAATYNKKWVNNPDPMKSLVQTKRKLIQIKNQLSKFKLSNTDYRVQDIKKITNTLISEINILTNIMQYIIDKIKENENVDTMKMKSTGGMPKAIYWKDSDYTATYFPFRWTWGGLNKYL